MKIFLITSMFLATLLLQSCLDKKSSNKVVTNTPTPAPGFTPGSVGTGTGTGTGTGGTGPGGTVDTSCSAPGTGTQPFDYYTLPSIIAHGKSSNVVAWSSATDPRLQTPTAQNMFVTDARFQVRVLAHPSPGKAIDTYNNVCTMEALPYTRLQVKVGVKLPGAATYFATHIFEYGNNTEIEVNGCSPSYSFALPPHTGPLVVEVMNVKWDYSCTWDKQMGVPESSSSYCPWGLVWVHDCYEISLQIATDYTKGLP
ncbi:MAG: hypothetical protein HYV97_19800 [Bdellovibrio sp.]|nr:hypothetical protein [Bdellovibrio sp.]